MQHSINYLHRVYHHQFRFECVEHDGVLAGDMLIVEHIHSVTTDRDLRIHLNLDLSTSIDIDLVYYTAFKTLAHQSQQLEQGKVIMLVKT